MGFFSKMKSKMDAAPTGNPYYRDTMILIYNLTKKDKGMEFDVMCDGLGIKLVYVKKEDYLQPIGALAGLSCVERTDEVYEGEGFPEVMAVLKNFTSVGMTDFKERMRRTNGVASHFDLEAILNTKNMNMNSLELRNMLYEKKTGKKAVDTAAEEMDSEE
ncbi:MAG: hypothetical protein IJ486_02005 [Firmicutes bacterium]|nr:hypothetical protein [Bacillota bacterium]